MADVCLSTEKVLRKQLDHIAKEHKYDDYEAKITPISSGGANYTSVLFLATVTAANKPDLKLFAKVATVGEKFREQMFVPIFDVENYAYYTLAKFYEKIQDKYEVPDELRYRMPKIYRFDLTYLEETLVLEDLTAQGFTTYSRFKSMDWEYAAKSLEQLAKWHALSLVFQEEYPEEFEKVVQTLKVRDGEDTEKLASRMVQTARNTVSSITNEDHKERLSKFFDEMSDMEYVKQFFNPMKKPLLTHGDFRMSNIMHRPVGQDKLEVVLLDYQCVHVGCAARDILFFLVSGTDQEFREKHFYPLLDHYYEHLCFMLKLLGREPDVVFPREDFDYEMNKNMKFGLFLAMFILPVMTTEVEDAPKIDSEFGIESLMVAKTSDLYESRVNEMVADFVKWGII